VQPLTHFLVKMIQELLWRYSILLGNKVSVLLDESVIGEKRIVWDGTNAAVAKLQTRIYFIRLQTLEGARISKVLMQ
jgi:hypothetical protein